MGERVDTVRFVYRRRAGESQDPASGTFEAAATTGEGSARQFSTVKWAGKKGADGLVLLLAG